MGPGVYLPEDFARAPPIVLPDRDLTAFIGQFDVGPGTAPAVVTDLSGFKDRFGAAMGGSLAAAGIAAFFAAGGKRALVVPADDLNGSGLGVALSRLGGLEFAMLAAPDAAGNMDFHRKAAALCAGKRALLLVDMARGLSAKGVADWLSGPDAVTGADVAAYAPWVTGPSGPVPPSGAAAGAIARVELELGITAVPAASHALLPGFQPELTFSDADITRLSDASVNAIRALPRTGTLLWGARTRSPDPEWRYVHVRRTWQTLALALETGLQWVAFEPMGPPLWAKVSGVVEELLLGLWQAGKLLGPTPRDSYFVHCGPATMTAADIAAGRLVVEIGFAMLRANEFVILRSIHQTAMGA